MWLTRLCWSASLQATTAAPVSGRRRRRPASLWAGSPRSGANVFGRPNAISLQCTMRGFVKTVRRLWRCDLFGKGNPVMSLTDEWLALGHRLYERGKAIFDHSKVLESEAGTKDPKVVALTLLA